MPEDLCQGINGGVLNHPHFQAGSVGSLPPAAGLACLQVLQDVAVQGGVFLAGDGEQAVEGGSEVFCCLLGDGVEAADAASGDQAVGKVFLQGFEFSSERLILLRGEVLGSEFALDLPDTVENFGNSLTVTIGNGFLQQIRLVGARRFLG